MKGETYIRVFERNGNFDFAVSGEISKLSPEQMKEVREKLCLALCRAQDMNERAERVRAFSNQLQKAAENMAQVLRDAFPNMK